VGGAGADDIARSSGGGGDDDPLKSVKGFVRAPKRGGHHDEELTDMEVGPLAVIHTTNVSTICDMCGVLSYI
jgi:hypothetical protein